MPLARMPVRAVADGERRREVRRAGLHGGVHGVAGEPSHPLDGVDVHDRPATPVDHRPQERLGHREQVPQVDAVHRLPRRRIRVVEAHERPVVADVVHQDVDAAVLVQDRGARSATPVLAAHVDHVGARRAAGVADRRGDRGGAVLVDLGDLDERPVLREQRCHPAPIPAPPPVTTATLPSSSRFQSSTGGTSDGSAVTSLLARPPGRIARRPRRASRSPPRGRRGPEGRRGSP